MSLPFLRTLRPFLFLALLSGLLPSAVRADLVWSAATGWRMEGGVLSGLTGAEGNNALDQMNKARAAEESGRQWPPAMCRGHRTTDRTYTAAPPVKAPPLAAPPAPTIMAADDERATTARTLPATARTVCTRPRSAPKTSPEPSRTLQRHPAAGITCCRR